MDDDEAPIYSLALPFIVTTSHGGPYDDDAFVAGFRAGQIYQALTDAPAQAQSLQWTVESALVHQLELIGMDRGFMVMSSVAFEEAPGWSQVVFMRGSDPPVQG